MGGAVLTSLALFYLARSMGLDEQRRRASSSSRWSGWSRSGRVVVGRARGADLGPGRAQARHLGELRARRASGSAIVAGAPSPAGRLRRRRCCTASRPGIFLAVDWALMTDIIPKASSGRYMGLSNVATASAGVLAIAVGGTLMDVVGGRARRVGPAGRAVDGGRA